MKLVPAARWFKRCLPQYYKLFGTTGSSGAYQLRDFLQRSAYPFTWLRDSEHPGLQEPNRSV
jgi:hypothetical protein